MGVPWVSCIKAPSVMTKPAHPPAVASSFRALQRRGHGYFPHHITFFCPFPAANACGPVRRLHSNACIFRAFLSHASRRGRAHCSEICEDSATVRKDADSHRGFHVPPAVATDRPRGARVLPAPNRSGSQPSKDDGRGVLGPSTSKDGTMAAESLGDSRPPSRWQERICTGLGFGVRRFRKSRRS